MRKSRYSINNYCVGQTILSSTFTREYKVEKRKKNLSLLHSLSLSPSNRIKQQWSSSSSSYRNNKRKRITFIWTFGSLNNLNSWLKNDFKKVHSCSTASSSNAWIFVLIKWHVLLSNVLQRLDKTKNDSKLDLLITLIKRLRMEYGKLQIDFRPIFCSFW